jgi:hypothetical protein
MDTLEITTTQKTTEKKTITFPYYAKSDDGSYLKLLDKETAWRIDNSISGFISISRAKAKVFETFLGSGKEITKDEFDMAWVETLAALLPDAGQM